MSVSSPINPLIHLDAGVDVPAFDDVYKGYFMDLTSKTVRMFKFEGLPETVNEGYLKTSIILTGNCALYYPKAENIVNKALAPEGWYAVKGTLGAQPTAYYTGSEYIIANPLLGSENIKLTDNRVQVFFWNTLNELLNPLTSGLYFLIDKTSRVLAEIYRSTIIALKNSRVVNIFSASNTNEAKTLNKLLKAMRNGEDVFTAIQDFKAKMQVNPVLENTKIKDILQEFVELEQFTLAQFYHAIGVNSNYNLKRAQINNEEIMTNSYILIVSLADVLPTLQAACEEFNSKTGLSISVDYSPEWKEMQQQQNEGKENDKDRPNLDENEDKAEQDNTEEEKAGDDDGKETT